VASVDHVLVLGFVTALGYELVRDGLIVGPPLRALDVFLRRAHLRGQGAGSTKLEIGAGIGICRAYIERTHIPLAQESRHTPQQRYSSPIRTSARSRLVVGGAK
jgi:hypothetical protein